MEIEPIPDESKLFYHISRSKFKAQNYDFSDVPPDAFTPQGTDGLSVNWDKFCKTAQECLEIKTEGYPEGRTPKTHGVGHFVAGDARQTKIIAETTIFQFDVLHDPDPETKPYCNKAHSLITGLPLSKPKPPYNQMRKELKRMFIWDIEPEPIQPSLIPEGSI